MPRDNYDTEAAVRRAEKLGLLPPVEQGEKRKKKKAKKMKARFLRPIQREEESGLINKHQKDLLKQVD